MVLTIDSKVCDLPPKGCAVPGYDAAALADVDACREGRSLKIALPATRRNAALLAPDRDPYAAERFNASLHTAELSADGARLLAGTVRLLSLSDREYVVEIRDGGARWASEAALRMLDTLEVPYDVRLTAQTVEKSWRDSSPVKFLPVLRDEYPQRNGSSDLQPSQRLLSVDDYHPFLHVATLTERIFRRAGYRVESRFLESEFFRSLYMSGAYSSRDTAAVTARMGFLAGRLSEATAAADYSGRVYADAKALYNTVGNVVETATPRENGAAAGCFDNGGCFSLDDGQIVFTPPVEVNVGFEYYLKYTTEHRILNRERLCGFDSVYLGGDARMNFALANRYRDRRDALSAGYGYRVVVFEHVQGREYRLTYTKDGTAGEVWTRFSGRSAKVSTPATGTYARPALEYLSDVSRWIPYPGDWALYDGYVEERGETTVELRVHTASERLSAGEKRYFNRIHFFGAEEGMRLTLHTACTLRPRFAAGPGYGSRLTFADVARHGIRQSELLEALAHLFNLRFLTDEETRTVRVEPADDFFGSGVEADWRDRTDFSQPVVFTEIAPGTHERRTWCYREGDGAVRRFDAVRQTVFGAWSAAAESCAALKGEEVLRNPLFSPTLDAAGRYADAPSALIMQVGDRDDVSGDGTNFSTRIVRFAGMKSLPDGERWGYPLPAAEYPFAAFHFAGDGTEDGFTLCFEDRDGQRGLHRYYDRQAALEGSGLSVTLSLRLDPHQYEALMTPGCGMPDLRSAFLVDTGCGVLRAHLRAVGEYDPAAASVRCTFTPAEAAGA